MGAQVRALTSVKQMFLPYTTDAPIYYWPFATVGLILVNVLVFAAVMFGDEVAAEYWILSFGDGLHPLQWLTSIFMHAGPMHLIGNMIFLWVFGLVVEGTLGWWRFLCCYLAIGMAQMAVTQLVMLGYTGEMVGALGASGAIFGLIAMAMIWAPMNEITFFYWIAFYVGTYDISIALMAGLYTGWEVLMICIFGGDAGTSWLHLTGFVLGLPIGIVLLKRGIVDCEGWDAFNVWSGNVGAFKKEPATKEIVAEVEAKKKQKDDELLDRAKQQFRLFMQQGNALAAARLYEKMKGVRGGIVPGRSDWLAMIQALHQEKRWAESAPLMAQCIDAFPNGADAMRIKLAQICVVELQRPGRAIDLLGRVDAKSLPPNHAELVKKIKARAFALQSEGIVELDNEAW
jgi:membrane associated rhomboid family serine protease